MNRFFKLPKQVLAIALLCTVVAVGCTGNQIAAYINLAAQTAANVLQIESAFAGTPVSVNDAALITGFQGVLNKSVSDFEADKSAGNSALVSVAEAAQTNIPAFLAAAQFDNPALGARVTTAADSFLTIVESIAVIVEPNVVVAPAPVSVALKAGGVYRSPARYKVSRSDIVNQWNHTVCAGAAVSCLVK